MSMPSGWNEKGLSWWMAAAGEESRVVPDSRWCRDMCWSSVIVQRWRKRDMEEQGLPGRLDDENIHSVGDGKGEWPWRWKGLTSRKGSKSMMGCTVRDQSPSWRDKSQPDRSMNSSQRVFREQGKSRDSD